MKRLIDRMQDFVRTDTARLMSTYLCIIMIMSASFSLVLYTTSVNQLERQRPPRIGMRYSDFDGTTPTGFREFISERIEEGKQEIARNLVILNLLMLTGGAIISYYLARRSLEPIEAAMEAQTQFVSDASHELRTPLTALRAGNEVALRRSKLTLKEARETIEDNLHEVDRLQQLTDGLLRLLAQNDTPSQTQPVSLQEAVGLALASVAKKATDKRISVEDTTPAITVLGDLTALVQLLTILIDNAVKYSPEDSTISVTAAPDSKGNVTIEVRDQGIGITEADAPHIFSRFYRADCSRSQTEGYGLGLPIAHKLVQAHHGTLSMESTPGQGSVFFVSLPAPQAK